MSGPTPCTRCGAPLPETDGPRVCAACGQYHEPGGARSSARTGPRPTVPVRVRQDRGGGAVGCVVVLAVVVPIVVAIAAVVVAVRAGSGGSEVDIDGVVGTDLLPSSGDLLVLPGDLDDDPDVVTMATPVGDSHRVVALVELEEGPVWEAEVVPDDVYSAQFAATDDVVLASLGRQVVGLDRGTGEVLWEGEASDLVHPTCPTCFVVVDDTLVALGSDGIVTAFDPTSGDVLWEHRFTSPAGRVVPVGDAVLLVDDGPEADPAAALTMVRVRPSDGAELARFTPGCVDEQTGSGHSVWATPTLPVIPVPGTDDVVLAYGLSPSCVQRWNTSTGEQRWSRLTEARLDWYDADDEPWAIGDTDLVLAGYEHWLVVGLAEGGVREVAAPPDSQAAPAVALAGDRFVGLASSTRGTTEWSLVAHELRSGDEVWSRELGADHGPAVVGPQSSTQSVDDTALFAVLPVDDELRLLTIGPPGPRFEVATLDRDTGEGEVVGVAPVRTDSPASTSARIETVRDGRALVDADGVLQVVDLRTGEVGAAWGR